MTKPFVDQGELRTLGYLNSPWYCFGLLARASWLESPGNRDSLRGALSLVLREASAFLSDVHGSCNVINAFFGIPIKDAQTWLKMVRFPTSLAALHCPAPMLRYVLRVLCTAGLVKDRTTGRENAAACGYSLELDVCDACVVLQDGIPPRGEEEVSESGSPAPPSFSVANDGTVRDPWWWNLVPSIGVIPERSENWKGGGDSPTQHHLRRQRSSPPSPINVLDDDMYTSRLTGFDFSQLNIAHRLLSDSGSIDEGLGENRVMHAQSDKNGPSSFLEHNNEIKNEREAQRHVLRAEKEEALKLVGLHLLSFGGELEKPRVGTGKTGSKESPGGLKNEGNGGGNFVIPFRDVSKVVHGSFDGEGKSGKNILGVPGTSGELPWHTKTGMSVDFG